MTGRARRASHADVTEIVRVVNAAYRVEDFFIRGDRTSAEDVRARMARPGAEILVLDDETPGRLAGLVYLERRPGALWFGMLSVDPVKQGRGIARRLIGAVEVQARAEGLARVEIDVVDLRTELPAFYARLGYVQVGERPFPDPHKLTRPARMLVFRKRLEHAS
ncbi:MAG: GNAT family N-acetyltransferase [Gemmatimonadetes bacterium]|nr:GNAT family N-acetyltransferase [Gemmatimonadota bacterium]